MSKRRLSFDEVVREAEKRREASARHYLQEEVELIGFKGNMFDCTVWKTHINGWYLTDFDERYYKIPDLYPSPNLVKNTKHYALFNEVDGVGNALFVHEKILKYKEHATEYINKLIRK